MRKLILLAACFGLVLAVTLQHLWQWWQQPFPAQRSVSVTINSGSSLQSVALTLADLGALRYPALWQLAARAKGLDNQIKQGEYELGSELSPARLLAVLVAGRVVQYSVTLMPSGTVMVSGRSMLR